VYSDRRAKRNENLRHNPRVSLHLNDDGRGNDIVLIEGEARFDEATPRPQDNAAYNAKYGEWIAEMFATAEDFTSVYNVPVRIRPTRARAFGA
jgi:PPOX class probable F420-dependent enzyme